MPAVSERQRRFMFAELGRKRKGLKTKTGMTKEQLEEFAHGSLEDELKRKKKGKKY